MKVLVIGSGGREHAICWKLKQSSDVSLYAAPGNPGMAKLAECVSIKVDDLDGLVNFAQKENIDFTIVGPEYPLTLGVVDKFQEAGLKVFGPNQQAAQLEGSKSFAKEVMDKAGVKTAAYKECNSEADLKAYIEEKGAPIVLKADGLAAGKGVFVCQTKEDALNAATELFNDFNETKVVVEEFLTGSEASYIVATDGERIVPFASSHDYKRIYDQDQGPNTGGMGTVSPTPHLSQEQEEWILENVMRPMVKQMATDGIKYQGFLYAGLMISDTGEINVVEFNARLGDPETQVILRRMEGDLLKLLLALVDGTELPEQNISKDSAVCVVLASKGYPQKPETGDEITGINLAEELQDTIVFHAGTKTDNSQLLTAGGRVLNVTSLGSDLSNAIQNTYRAADLVQFRGVQMRRDIGS